MHEGRFQQALELARQLNKQEASTANADLLQKAAMGRAQQLLKSGHLSDARSVLESVAQTPGATLAWQEDVAEELAKCGAVREALDLLTQIPQSQAQVRVLGHAADWAMQLGASGRAQLPESLHGPFGLLLNAFRQVEQGQDEAARETLQGIGLQSPFLEWKVLLRGLMAYYQKDDVRAVENWQRLSQDRLPARLIAPLRFQIDAAYRRAQVPEVQNRLQKLGDRFQDSSLVPPLRSLQAVLADTEQLPRAFRLAESLLPALRAEAPHLVPRLASCFFWAIVSNGEPEDVHRYQRVFGTPLDDPKVARLRALLHEHMGEFDKAHKSWQEFELSIREHPAVWPDEQAKRARALVWNRMGQNAAKVPGDEVVALLPPFLRDHPSRPKPLKPPADKCFQQSLELDPNQLEAHEALFHYYQGQKKDDKAKEAAQRLLEHFPDHVPTLEALGKFLVQHGEYEEGLNLLQRALKVNPLDRGLRQAVAMAHLFSARTHAEEGHFAEARREYHAALSYRDRKDESAVYCKWAACEYKAGDAARAEELLQQALAESGSELAVNYSMVIEATRLKLASALKTRFNKGFNAGLAQPPSGQAAAKLADIAHVHHLGGFNYYGQKTHEKKVVAYLEKALKVELTEEQLEQIGRALVGLQNLKLLTKFTQLGQRKFPHNPYFYFLEAEGYFARGPYQCPAWKVQPLLSKARELALQRPADERQKELLEALEERQQMLGASGFLNNPQSMEMFETILDQMYDMDDYGGGDEDEDEYYY
jgi:tetratricopeptide (TPR) repeat protein